MFRSIRVSLVAVVIGAALTAHLYAAPPVMGPGNAVYVNHEYFESNLNLNNIDTLTVSVWIKRVSGLSSWDAIVSNDNGGYDKALTFYGNNYYIFAGASISTGVASVLNEWEFMTMVMTPDDIKLYKNGVLEYDHGSGYAGTSGDSQTCFFCDPDGNWYLDGAYADEIRVWNTELTQEEIQTNMNRVLTGSESNLVAYYRFDTSTGGTFTDASVSGFNSTYTTFEGDELSPSDIFVPWPMDEDDTLTSVGAWDPDDDSITLMELVAPDYGSVAFDNAAGTFTYIPDADFAGTDSFTCSATDIGGSADTLTVVIEVAAFNDAPRITSAAADTAGDNQPFTYTATVVDPDDTPTIDFSPLPGWLTQNGSILTGTPAQGTGDTVFTIYTTDGVSSDTLTVALTVLDVNNPPVADRGDGNALEMGGSDEYVSFDGVAAAMAGATDFTVEFWVKGDYRAQSTSYGAGLLCVNTGTGGNVLLIRMDRTTGRLEFGSDYGDGIGDDQWHHVALVRDGSDVAVYIDGSLEGTTTSSAAFSADDQWSLGQEWDNALTSDHFTGSLEEVRVWSVVRSRTDIRDYMYRNVTGAEVGLEAWFNFDHSSGSVLTDLTGHGYDGTLHNMEDGDWVASDVWENPEIVEDADLTINAGSDADGDSLAITVESAPTGGALTFDNGAATVMYTPDPDYFGIDSFSYVITDTAGGADTAVITLEVLAVNDAPSFTAGGSDTVNEDAGARTVAGWASGITAGPANEAAQTLTFTVANDNNDLFAVQPDVDEVSGDLTYTPAPDAFGEAQVIVYLSDDGGTDLEGIDESAPDTFLITINGSTDDPPMAGSGRALDFDGSGDYVSIPDADALDMTMSYTLEAWICPRSFNWLGGIISKYNSPASNGFNLRLSGAAPYNGISFDEMNTATGILEADTWYHIAAVNDNGTRHLYVNGVEQTLTGTALTPAVNTDPVAIGMDYLSSPRYFNGLIDEVRIWNTARTRQEITDDRISMLTGSEPGLVAYYRCDENSGSDLPDMSGNNNPGTLMNMDDADWVDSDAWRERDMDENDTLVLTAGYDPDNDTLAITAKDAPANGTLVMDDRKVTVSYIPDAGWFGTDTFSYYLTDTVSNDSFEVVVTVNTTNQAPVGPGDHTGLTFGGVNDYMDFDGVAALMSGDQTFTFEFWARPYYASFPEASADMFSVNTSTGGNTVLIGCNRADGSFFVYDGFSGAYEITGTDRAVSGEWSHVAYVRNGATGYLYVNGVLQGSHAAGYTLAANDNWSLGMELDGGTPTNEYVGDLDEVRVWNTVLSQAELQGTMHRELAGNETGLTGYWRLNDGTGATAYDATDNGNDGTLMYDTDWIITDRPVFLGYPEMNEDAALSLSLGSDPDGDVLTFLTLLPAANGAVVVDSVALTFTYTPTADWNGYDTLVYCLTDPEGLRDTMGYVISVNPVADPVVLTSAAVDTATENTVYEYIVMVNDIDGDAVLSIQEYPAWATVTGDTLSGTAPLGSHGDTSFVVIASNSMYVDTLVVNLAIKDSTGFVPVELSSFTASAAGNDVIVRWTTATETDNLGFHVLKAAAIDGPYEQVNGSLIPGAGSTALPQSYSFMDADVAPGTWYYMLEQKDVNGTVNLSDAVAVEAGINGIHTGAGSYNAAGLRPVVQYNLDGTLVPAGAQLKPGMYIKMLNGSAVKVLVTD